MKINPFRKRYHPFIVQYCEGDKIRDEAHVFSIVKSSLIHHRDIMGLHWFEAEAISHTDRGVFSEVYTYGWDNSSCTKELHRYFENVVEYQPKKLEDFL